jgi:hypothetical protein
LLTIIYRLVRQVAPVQTARNLRKIGFLTEEQMSRKFFDHEQFNFEFQCALGGVHLRSWEWRAKPYGLQSPFDVFSAARQYNLADVADQITTPIADHGSRRRAVLATSITATLRQASGEQATGPIHRRRRRRPILRAIDQITPRATHVRLAGRNPPSRDQQSMNAAEIATNRTQLYL